MTDGGVVHPGCLVKGLRTGVSQRAWVFTPLMVVLTVSVTIAATSDPDWYGTPSENVSHSSQHRAWQPAIAADSSGQVVIAWSDERTGVRDIYATNGDGGAWSAPQAVAKTTKTSHFPDVLAVGDRPFVVWVEAPTAIRETEIGTGDMRLISSPVALVDAPPRLVGGAGRLHVVFSAGAANIPDIYYTSRLLTETVWLAAKRIYASPALFGSWWPALAISPDGGTLHAVWENKGLAIRSIAYMKGTVSGANVNWSSATTLSTGITRAINPDVAADSQGNVHVVWGEIGAGGYDEQYVRYTRYDAASDSWTTPAVLVDLNPVQTNPEIPLFVAPSLALWEKGNRVTVCVAWYGFWAGDPGAEEVLVRCSQDGGVTWSSAVTENTSRTTSSAGWEVSMRPAIAFDGWGRLHVAWQERAGDDLTEDYEVYYSRALSRVFLPLVARSY